MKEVAKGREATYRDKGKGIADSIRNKKVKCFKCLGKGPYATDCPNRRVMVIKDREWYTDDEKEAKGEELQEEGEN